MTENDENWDDLEDDADAERIQREQLNKNAKKDKVKKELFDKGHGVYREVKEEDFIKEVTSSMFIVVHFYHHEFERCKIVDRHMTNLASKHLETKFIKIHAPSAPFFVTKLGIKVLPCICLFQDGKCVEKIVGFDEFGGVDDFSTSTLERKLQEREMLIKSLNSNNQRENGSIYGNTKNVVSMFDDNESDDD